MRPLILTAMLALCGCSAEQRTATLASAPEVVIPDYSLDAFGGHLLGTDRGEWLGKLVFQDADGRLKTLLNENVRGIVRNADGVFVFTGLAHLSINDGYIHVVHQEPDGPVSVTRLGHLPGAPSRVRQLQPGGATSFLVYAGLSGDRQLFECYQLSGKIVSPGHNCLPPE